MSKRKITLNGVEVRIKETDFGEFLCITDLAKVIGDNSGRIINNWFRLIGTIEYLKEWELKYNPDDFNVLGYEDIRMQAGTVQFSLSAKKWISTTHAKGVVSDAGRYGGTYAHNAIAIEFCTAISPAFKLGVYTDYLELKEQQAQQWLKNYQFYLDKIEDSTLEAHRISRDLRDQLKGLE